jgi:hypothetical protein
MYLISIYFDGPTEKKIRDLIKLTAEYTGNSYMLDGDVPPHITVSAFETKREVQAIEVLEQTMPMLMAGKIQWVSLGQFLPYVLFLSPVLDEYLFSLCKTMYDAISILEETNVSRFYRPFQWIPHTTIGKKLSPEEMRKGFEVLQKSFGPFSGEVVRIGLAKTNPYRDIATWELRP